jgi:hypothetical protein
MPRGTFPSPLIAGTPVTVGQAWVDPADLACITVADDREAFANAASQLLRDATYGVYGVVTETVRPWGASHAWVRGGPSDVAWIGSAWQLPAGTVCGCGGREAVSLLGATVVTSVKIGGATLDASAWRLEPDALVRIDGGRWPACQNMLVADTEPGTFSVTYQRGRDPGELGRLAAKQLACQLWKFDQDAACGLPAGTRSVIRQGVTFDLAGWLNQGKTGLPLVDAFLAGRTQIGSGAYSPEIATHLRRSL